MALELSVRQTPYLSRLDLQLLSDFGLTAAVGKSVLYFAEEFRILEGFKKEGRADLVSDGPNREILTAGYDD
jgi:hypothetical protein